MIVVTVVTVVTVLPVVTIVKVATVVTVVTKTIFFNFFSSQTFFLLHKKSKLKEIFQRKKCLPPKKYFPYNFFLQLFLLNQHTSFTKNFSHKKMLHKKKFSEIFFQIKTSFHYFTFFPPKNFFQLKSVLPYPAAPRPHTFAWSGLCQHG